MLQLDVTDAESIAMLAEQVEKQHGRSVSTTNDKIPTPTSPTSSQNDT